MINIHFKNVMKWSVGTGAVIGAAAGFFMLPKSLIKDLSGKDIGPKNDNMFIEAMIWSTISAGTVAFVVVKSINYCRTNNKDYLPFTEDMHLQKIWQQP